MNSFRFDSSFNIYAFLTQKYDDYLDILSDILSEAKIEKNGKTVNAWSGDELEELICGQVVFSNQS